MSKHILLSFVLLVALGTRAPEAFAKDRWIATWGPAPQIVPPQVAPGARPAAAAPAANAPQLPMPQGPVSLPPTTFHDQTIRMVAHTTIGGRRVRVQLTNAFSKAPLEIGAAHIARRDRDSAIMSGTDRVLTFDGKPRIKIPAGAEALSDPVELDVPALSDVLISVYVPGDVTDPTFHFTGLHPTYISPSGDQTAAAAIADGAKSDYNYMLSALQVMAPENTGVVVALGDSITDGFSSTPDTNRSWPDQLAARLLANKATSHVAVINKGISGNQVLGDFRGISALARLDRDVLAQPGAKWLMVLEGINDIGLNARDPAAMPTAADLIAGYVQLIERAHEQGIKVIGTTLTPYKGSFYYTDDGEAVRTAVNDWIRNRKAFDAVVDFDKIVRDPNNPKEMLAAYYNRDHLHPNDTGYKVMADAIDLALFKGR